MDTTKIKTVILIYKECISIISQELSDVIEKEQYVLWGILNIN